MSRYHGCIVALAACVPYNNPNRAIGPERSSWSPLWTRPSCRPTGPILTLRSSNNDNCTSRWQLLRTTSRLPHFGLGAKHAEPCSRRRPRNRRPHTSSRCASASLPDRCVQVNLVPLLRGGSGSRSTAHGRSRTLWATRRQSVGSRCWRSRATCPTSFCPGPRVRARRPACWPLPERCWVTPSRRACSS